MNLKKIIEETFMEVMIEQVTKEVLKRLKRVPKKALVILTGGSIGFYESMNHLKKLNKAGWQFKILLSYHAECIYTKKMIENMFDSKKVKVYGEQDDKELSFYYKDVDCVMIPVLTMNTAAKVALGIGDNLITTIIGQLLMMNVPILAVKDAADPFNPKRIEMGMGKAFIAYKNMLKDHLDKLKSYGIQLVSASTLYDKVLDSSQESKALPPKFNNEIILYTKKVLTQKDVMFAHHMNKYLILSKETILTPSAKDCARNLGVKMTKE